MRNNLPGEEISEVTKSCWLNTYRTIKTKTQLWSKYVRKFPPASQCCCLVLTQCWAKMNRKYGTGHQTRHSHPPSPYRQASPRHLINQQFVSEGLCKPYIRVQTSSCSTAEKQWCSLLPVTGTAQIMHPMETVSVCKGESVSKRTRPADIRNSVGLLSHPIPLPSSHR